MTDVLMETIKFTGYQQIAIECYYSPDGYAAHRQLCEGSAPLKSGGQRSLVAMYDELDSEANITRAKFAAIFRELHNLGYFSKTSAYKNGPRYYISWFVADNIILENDKIIGFKCCQHSRIHLNRDFRHPYRSYNGKIPKDTFSRIMDFIYKSLSLITKRGNYYSQTYKDIGFNLTYGECAVDEFTDISTYELYKIISLIISYLCIVGHVSKHEFKIHEYSYKITKRGVEYMRYLESRKEIK